MKWLPALACALVVTGAGWSQVGGPAFEVASIKPSGPDLDFGQMTRDPRRIALARVSVQNLMAQAYRISNFQIAGPGWLDTDRFDIVATIPDGVSQDQVPAMMQRLLKDRFGLALHQEQRMMNSYALVPRQGGAKLKAVNAEVG